MSVYHCTCCDRDVDAGGWDYLYTSCHECAFEASLEHFPCDHGAAEKAEREALRSAAAKTEEKP